jgi:ComF family protein
MKYGGQPYLAKGAAAYLVLQLDALEWPLPDVIVPVPISFFRRFDRGYNQSLLLAQALGALIDRPIADVLHRTSSRFSQASLSRKLRMDLSAESFTLSKKGKIEDQIVLVIDDVATTGSTLRCCAETLQARHPAKIYGLTLCYTS